ncbi:ribonuclease, Rne/Rng family domain protein [Neorickettsia helminthoeca str. Oregon]|uniref:Ribonuclease G n=1 Tax=Neorickettsia helminthoeca str. Oregon TaxID=1286528 RepID=X5GVK8_9RICK|nr:Rne/Rng family ribonuclease [Neorickettsia helminthoeca]AHX11077.1 ribonuclease, Rne/Rng family domain protein [Neorickettsia helminthoeca str. Oregon]
MKKILIDSTEDETRVAILKDGLLIGYDLESASNLPQKGNIYLGVVFRVDDSLQAAFVEYLPGEYGFLPFSEIPVTYFDLLEDVKVNAIAEDKHVYLYKNFNATEVIKKGLVIFVQVTKEKRRNKDVTLTAYVRLPNRYCVLMPFSKDFVLSKQISDEKAVNRLTQLVEEKIGDRKYGVIFKSYCENADEKNIINDYNLLVSQWDAIASRKEEGKAPRLIFREANLVKKILRDSYDSSVGAIIINDKHVYQETVDYVQSALYFDNHHVTLYEERLPLFDKYKVEAQIDSLYEENVPLRNGGYIVINTTEALTAIDVNSGRMKKETNIEETAYKVNMDAVVEIVRQLELRGIAGIIVIDLIDMSNSKYIANVEKALLDGFKRYKARVQITSINKFGLVTISKQRTRHNISEFHMAKCPQCGGKGKTLKLEYQVRRVFSSIYTSPPCREVSIITGPEMAAFLFNNYRSKIIRAEEEIGVKISIKVDVHMDPLKGFEISVQGKDKGVSISAIQEKNHDVAPISEGQVAIKETPIQSRSLASASRRSWVASWIRRLVGSQ